MSHRDKARARAKEILRRSKPVQDHTSHLTALRNVPVVDVAAAADAVRAETPILADVIRRVGIVPEPPAPWNDHTQLLPLVVEVDGRELVSAERAA